MQEPRPRWSPSTKLTISLLLMAFGIYLLYRFRAVIEPLILAILLAYVLTPLANLFQKRLGIRRGLSTLFVYLVVILVLTAILLILIPMVTVQSAGLNLNFQNILSQIETFFGKQFNILGREIAIDQVYRQVVGSIAGLFEPFFGRTLSLVFEVITSLVWVLFIVVFSFYLVKDGQKFIAWLVDVTPLVYRNDFIRLGSEINLVWGAFFRGQLVLALLVTTIFIVVGLIIGLPFALAMGLLAGLLEFLPSLGHGIWLAIAALLALFAGSTWLPVANWVFMLLVIGLHAFFQQFDLNYLIPRVVGRRVHLPPVLSILGIVAGALLAGVLGILLAAPTIASARVIGRYIYANLFEQEPFPTTLAETLPPPNPRWWRKSAAHGQEEQLPSSDSQAAKNIDIDQR